MTTKHFSRLLEYLLVKFCPEQKILFSWFENEIYSNSVICFSVLPPRPLVTIVSKRLKDKLLVD